MPSASMRRATSSTASVRPSSSTNRSRSVAMGPVLLGKRCPPIVNNPSSPGQAWRVSILLTVGPAAAGTRALGAVAGVDGDGQEPDRELDQHGRAVRDVAFELQGVAA